MKESENKNNAADGSVESSDLLDEICRACQYNRVDRMLGFGKMPDGYALVLNRDGTHYYWINAHGQEGPITWDKWQARRMAIAHRDFVSSNDK